MPLCPFCQTPYEEGQRYCQQCDSYLLNPEEGNRFCPQCGIRVGAKQEVCHKCNANLPLVSGPTPETTTPPSPPKPEVSPPKTPEATPMAREPSLPLWALGALIAAGVVIVILAAIIIFRQPAGSPPTTTAPEKAPAVATLPKTEAAPATTPAAPEGKVTPEAAKPAEPSPQAPQTASPAAPAASPAASLEDQIKETFNNLREAQLRQDLILFMSCYSYIYPTLDKKRRDTQAYWYEFNFLGLDYTLDEVKPVGQDTALARVTWTMQVQSRRTHLIDTFMQTYEVGLAKELGKWRIRSLREIEED